MNIRRPEWLSKNSISLGFVSLFADFGSEMVTSLLPTFVVSLGGTAATLGLIEGIANATINFTKLFTGWYSDAIGKRKPFTIVGYSCNSIGIFFIYLATHWYHVLSGRVIARFGKGVREPARDAVLASSVEPRFYGRIFGFQRAMDTLGAIIGPLIALLLLAVIPIRSVFLVALLPNLIALSIVLLATKEPENEKPHRTPFFEGIRSVSPQFRSFLIACGIFGLGNFATTLLILRITQLLTPLYGLAYATSFTLFLYTLYNIMYGVSALPIGYLADRYGTVKILTIGYAFTGIISCALIFNSYNVYITSLIFIVAGAASATVETLQRSLPAALLQSNIYGTGYGIVATTKGAGGLLSNIIIGFLWSAVSPLAGFGFSAACCFTGAYVLIKQQR